MLKDTSELVKILVSRLFIERKQQYKNGIYHFIQTELAYNSNRIEGSKLSKEHTINLFNTKTILAMKDEVISSDDIVEANNHFRAFDYLLDVYDEPLSEDIIKKIHYILKNNTSDSYLEWFNVGEYNEAKTSIFSTACHKRRKQTLRSDEHISRFVETLTEEENQLFSNGGIDFLDRRRYKQEENMIGDIFTTAPEHVSAEIQILLKRYLSKEKIVFDDIVDFHYNFERIHPFQDGNGRVGRLIMFKECMKYGIIPFIINEQHKMYYYNGLRQFKAEKGFLTDTGLSAQDALTVYCRRLIGEFNRLYVEMSK